MPDAEYDSWLTVGIVDASDPDALSTVGIEFDSWTDTNGLAVDDGAVFWMDPDAAPEGDVVVAQLTVPSGSSGTVTMGMQGHSTRGEDWDVHRVVFAYPASVQTTVPVHSQTMPPAYMVDGAPRSQYEGIYHRTTAQCNSKPVYQLGSDQYGYVLFQPEDWDLSSDDVWMIGTWDRLTDCAARASSNWFSSYGNGGSCPTSPDGDGCVGKWTESCVFTHHVGSVCNSPGLTVHAVLETGANEGGR